MLVAALLLIMIYLVIIIAIYSYGKIKKNYKALFFANDLLLALIASILFTNIGYLVFNWLIKN